MLSISYHRCRVTADRADHLALVLQDAFRRGYLSSELLDHWVREAPSDAAAMITRARAELQEGDVTVR